MTRTPTMKSLPLLEAPRVSDAAVRKESEIAQDKPLLAPDMAPLIFKLPQKLVVASVITQTGEKLLELARTSPHVILDASDTTYMALPFLGKMLSVCKVQRQTFGADASIVFCGLSKEVFGQVDELRMNRLLRCYNTMEEAVLNDPKKTKPFRTQSNQNS